MYPTIFVRKVRGQRHVSIGNDSPDESKHLMTCKTADAANKVARAVQRAIENYSLTTTGKVDSPEVVTKYPV